MNDQTPHQENPADPGPPPPGGYDPPQGVSPRQEAAIVALINEPTIERAAHTAKVGARTLHRWLREPDFARAYRAFRREAFNQAIALTQRYAPLAVQMLAKVMTDASAPYQARVSAAAVLLRFGRDAIELDDLAGRVEALESEPLRLAEGRAA